MFRELRVGRSEACISDLRLDAWLGHELEHEQREELRGHLTTCARCRSREALLRRQREDFETAHPALPPWLALHDGAGNQWPRHKQKPKVETVESISPRARLERLGGPPSRPASRWRAARLLGGAAAAAGVLALASLTREPVRTKGGDHVSFYVKRGEQVFRGKARERVQSGDKLRFAYTAATPRYLAILSVDGARRASVFYPPAAHAVRVEAGTEVLLPSAVELDSAAGEEHILALFCDRPLPLEQIRAELQAKQTLMPAPGGCALDQLIVVKEATTP